MNQIAELKNHEPQETTSAALKGKYIFEEISWSGGFMDNVSIRFNEKLNVIIGGRGVGKSTVIESIRYLLTGKISGTFQSYINNVLLMGTQINLRLKSYYPSERTYLIRWEIAPDSEPIVMGQDELKTNLKIGDIIPFHHIYGQHDISLIANDKSLTTKVIKPFLDSSNLPMDRIEDIREKLKNNRTDILSTREELERIETRVQKLPGLKEMLDRYESSGLEEKLASRTMLAKEKNYLNLLVQDVEEFKQSLEILRTKTRFTQWDSQNEELPGVEILRTAWTMQEHFRTEALSCIELMEEEFGKLKKKYRTLSEEWHTHKENHESKINEILRELQAGSIDVTEFLRLRSQIDLIHPLEQRVEELQSHLKELQTERKTILNEYIDLQAAERALYEIAVTRINKTLGNQVRVHVCPKPDLEPLFDLFRSRIGGRLQESLNTIEKTYTNALTLAANLRGGGYTLVKEYGFLQNQAERIVDKGGENLAMLIEEFWPTIQCEIYLNTSPTNRNEEFKLINRLSMGQKATAILLILFMDSNIPLIIDQPEDDLDNRFIADAIVRTIREQKENRQFIFASHNANVPVLGDSENVILLTVKEQGKSQVDEQGDINQAIIRESINNLLEGGKEAFEKRREIYGY